MRYGREPRTRTEGPQKESEQGLSRHFDMKALQYWLLLVSGLSFLGAYQVSNVSGM